MDTSSEFDVMLVINQPAAAVYIHAPMLATTVAVQMTENALERNGFRADRAPSNRETLELLSDPESAIPSIPVRRSRERCWDDRLNG